MSTKQIGALAEDYAEHYLHASEYTIVARNWQASHTEIDLVCYDRTSSELVFVEVKSSQTGFDPLQHWHQSKQNSLTKAIHSYLNRFGDAQFRLDLITVEMDTTGVYRSLDHWHNVLY
ncbi:YraN family protein [Candidatus Gracilibacteria bacterium]|nr:YraN family protein [Candidatus Gracilibacteria bacterium]